MRIITEEQITDLVTRITSTVKPEDIDKFIEKRYTPYNKEEGNDAFITMKDGKHYLPYKSMMKVIAQLRSYGDSAAVEDEFDC